MFRKKKMKTDNTARPGVVVANKPKSVVTEQYRTIVTNIRFSMVDKDLKTIVVTSAAPGAGKSITSVNLAAVFASAETKVLLVDADMRKPTVHKTFKTRNTDGLTTLLAERDVQLKDKVYQTTIDNLYILPSGPTPPNPAELLASKRMERLTKEMEEAFDLIVFDTPPLSAVTDAQILASKMDGTVFVVRKNTAIKEKIMEAKHLLDMVGANVIGAILNRDEKADDAYYYYGNDNQ